MKKTYMTPRAEAFRVMVHHLVALSTKDGEANPDGTVYAPEYNRRGDTQRSGKSMLWDNEW